ncbi:hypothetical protein [Robbsia sp. KACC 23696]|uniref:hypothetical protein n=1 Tax=Robbsia sp. KACC 23696 TaxID=3149231 RepID=UPI00325B221E
MNCDYATKFDDVIVQGAVWERVFFITNPDDSPVNLRGASARLQIRPYLGSPNVLLDLDSANGSLVIGSVAGSVTCSVLGATTAGLKWPPGLRAQGTRISQLGVYDLIVTLDAKPYRVYEGRIDLSLSVTR